MHDLYADLNPAQLEAVTITPSPVLVVAGAGSDFEISGGFAAGSNNTMIVTGPGSVLNFAASTAIWLSGIKAAGSIGGSNTVLITDGGLVTLPYHYPRLLERLRLAQWLLNRKWEKNQNRYELNAALLEADEYNPVHAVVLRDREPLAVCTWGVSQIWTSLALEEI